MIPHVDEEVVVFISNFHELMVEHCSQAVSISCHFQFASNVYQKEPSGTEKQNTSVLEMVPVISELVKPRGKGGAEVVYDTNIILL